MDTDMNTDTSNDVDTDTPSNEARAATTSTNPWLGKKLAVNPQWASKLESTYTTFQKAGDTTNAAKVRKLSKTGMFVWISSIASIPDMDHAITSARAQQKATGVKQVVGLVVYDMPGRDWDGQMSYGELPATEEGYATYKSRFIKPIANRLGAATDLTFAVIVEPDAVGNLVTTKDKTFVEKVAPFYVRGVASAIKAFQFPNVHIYVDVANGGWLGWKANLQPSKLLLISALRDTCLTTPRSSDRHVGQDPQAGQASQRQQGHAHPRLLDQRVQLQRAQRGGPRSLHQWQRLVGRGALHGDAGSILQKGRAAAAVHRRPGPRGLAQGENLVVRLGECASGRVWGCSGDFD